MANRNIERQISEERGVDIRLPSYAILGISSRDRYKTSQQRLQTPTTPYSFSVQSPQNFLTGYFTRLAVTEIRFPWNIRTVNGKNTLLQFQYKVGAGPVINGQINVPIDWYTPTTLAAQIQQQISVYTGDGGPLAPFTCVADPTTGEFTADAVTVGNRFRFIPSVNPLEPNGTTLYDMMNWQSNTFPDGSFARNQFSGVPSLIPTRFVDIVSEQLTYNQDVKDADTSTVSRDLVCRLYLEGEGIDQNPELLGSQPFTVFRQFQFPKQIKWAQNQNIGGYIRFDVYDDQGYLLTAGSLDQDAACQDWDMTILASEV